MIDPAHILAVLLALPPWYQDAGLSDETRAGMLSPVADAVSDAATNPTEAAALVALGFHESRFARYVIEGRCSDGPGGARCDDGRARSPWQVWAVACPAAHALPDGTPEALDAAAKCAVRLLRGAQTRCHGQHPAGDLAGAFAGYAGRSCAWRGGAMRAQSTRAQLARLGVEEGRE